DVLSVSWEVGASVATHDGEGKARRSCDVAIRQPGVCMFLDLDEASLDGVPETVERSHARVTTPREHNFAGAAGADHTVINEIWGHPDKGEASTSLPDDLMASCEWDEVREPLQSHDVAVRNQVAYCRGERHNLRHEACTCSALSFISRT